MSRTDLRERYDLHEHRNEQEVAPDRFSEFASMEAYESGWVVIAAVVDDDGRVLLVYDEDDDCWVVPGGTVQPGEALREAIVRELKEEAGVEIEPKRPHSLIEVVCTDGEREMGFNVVGFGAEPVTTRIGTDLGVDDESITDAAWFDELPENLFERDHA
ncbi:MAG: NUDIX hydrolase, partial [Halolamina sp.]